MARFGDGLAVDSDLARAADFAVEQALAPLSGQRPDLLCVFVCGEDPEAVEAAGLRAMKSSEAGITLGCSAGGVIGGGRGVEMSRAVSVWAACLPDARCTPFQLESVPDQGSMAVTGLPDRHDDDAVAVLFADPHTFPADLFVQRSNDFLSGLPLIGGMASGPLGRGSMRLFVDGRPVDHGAVGVLLGGPVAARTVVSQGCRPIGPPMVVTRAEENVLLELAGTFALSKLEQVIQELSPEDRQVVAQGLHIGVAMDEYAQEHERGDFLIRPVMGADRERDAIAIGDIVEVGRTVRFQVRDAAGADQDLEQLFSRFESEAGPAEGALLFSCNGRGTAMFPSADHDVLAVRSGLGISGVGGFFAGGEIGPVGSRNYLHGFTASILAFGSGASSERGAGSGADGGPAE